jgi:NADH-quinone oxidoreductase subunit G
VGRGDHSTIGCAEGQTLDSAYSLNTVDVCPVGALTSSVFRFKQRVWNLRRTPSVCGGCSKGCNVQVDQRSSQVYRLLPRENQAVNQSWLCDDGRLTYNRSNLDRINEPLVRDGEFLRPTTVREATDTAIRTLAPHVTRPERLAVVITLHATNEETLAAARFVASVGAQPKLYALGYAPGEADALLRQADKNPNRAGIERVAEAVGLPLVDAAALEHDLQGGTVSAVLMVGSEAEGLEHLAQAMQPLGAMVHITFARTPLSDVAHVMLPGISWVQNDGTWLSGDQRLQALTPAFPPADQAKTPLMWLDTLAQGLGRAAQATSTPAWQAELSAASGAFAGIDFAAVGPQGLSLSQPTLQASA